MTSQLFFDQALIDEVFTTHPEYTGFGSPDTSNATDSIIPGEDVEAYILSWARMDDGALQVWKTLGIRASLLDVLCDA